MNHFVLTFNRTIVELKSTSFRSIILKLGSFNRTIVELKYADNTLLSEGAVAFNRTIVELKYASIVENSASRYF